MVFVSSCLTIMECILYILDRYRGASWLLLRLENNSYVGSVLTSYVTAEFAMQWGFSHAIISVNHMIHRNISTLRLGEVVINYVN